ncbi:hypothetical protein LP090_06660 [Moraxella bovis]|uniref:hypothetical protein n=1 Tax=Moraxella bovis TaxID=476 RepID=UPI000DC7A4CC|nr:hypothetical protein [Moraxella bovis]AWY19950.1 hypothetical protein DQF64_05210 [Moraxella bovis]UYZ74907.1 hypothetical protein LP093_09015 [Moraxella bovis]UYZ80253.1 hypothetical protein LP113_09380 [Moraxella bovis]UYZ87645.1 hypothetical protein LP094_04855 [Moraxella bovis]UYZ99672.1 hypothetical protein LP086_08925 [Moraxella bovis]
MKKFLLFGFALALVGCGQDETKAVQEQTAEVAADKAEKTPVKETGIRTLVINDISEINANAEQIKAEISAEDRALIEEYFSRAETLRLVSGDKSMFGVSLGEAIEKTKNHFERKSAMDDKIIAFNEIYKAELVSFNKSTKYNDGMDLKIKFTNLSDKAVSAIDGWVELEVEGIEKSDSLHLGTHKFDKPLAKGESAEITHWTEANSLATIKIEQGNAIAKMLFKDVTILLDDGTTDEVKQMY